MLGLTQLYFDIISVLRFPLMLIGLALLSLPRLVDKNPPPDKKATIFPLALLFTGLFIRAPFEVGPTGEVGVETWYLMCVLSLVVLVTGGSIIKNNASHYFDFIVKLWPFWRYKHADDIAALPDEYNPLYAAVDFQDALRVPMPLREIIVSNYAIWLMGNLYPSKATIRDVFEKTPPEERDAIFTRKPQMVAHAQAINKLLEVVPAHGLLVPGEQYLWDYIRPTLERAAHDDLAHEYYRVFGSLGTYGATFKEIKVGVKIPDAMRTEHMQVLANTGHGKTTLLTQMFFEDLKTDAGMVVIDSQGVLINELAARVPADRLILIDPKTCPPALNMFARKIEGEQGINNALAMFEYIFGSLGVSMTGKQEMVYRYLSRLCMVIPGGSINTLRDMLQPGGTEQYLPYIEKMNDNARAFFRAFEQDKNNQFKDTRQEVQNRLLKVLESDTFSLMLGADNMVLDIPQALAEGKVILVSTAKDLLFGGASLLGRIFVAQVMQAVRSRPQHDARRVYLYIDEFADYAEDSEILFDCFAQGRKYGLGMLVFHQDFERISTTLSAVISSNTAIKFAGGISAEDSRRMASQMRTDPREIDRQPKGTFLAYFKDIGTIPWPVKLGFINSVPRITSIYDVQEDMRKKYGAKPREQKPVVTPVEDFDPLNIDTSTDTW